MTSTSKRPGLVLVIGLAGILAAALSPAGLRDGRVPGLSWAVWMAGLVAAVGWLRLSQVALSIVGRRLAWLLPLVMLFALPAGLVVAPERRLTVFAALLLRALSAASLGVALALHLGPSGLVAGARGLRLPSRLCDILEAMLGSLTVVTRQVLAMLRAREARRPSAGAWADLLASPVETIRGFGRLVAVLLLRSLERAEALEQARRARGAGE